MINLFFEIGNLTRDPDLRYTAQGNPVCKFSIAINRKFNDKEDTTFLNVVTWSGLAENCAKYLNKGSKVAVVGEVRVNEWEKDGSKRKDYEINANQVEFLNNKKNDDNGDSEFSFGGE
jgi:single-strand DNA-binding protein